MKRGTKIITKYINHLPRYVEFLLINHKNESPQPPLPHIRQYVGHTEDGCSCSS